MVILTKYVLNIFATALTDEHISLYEFNFSQNVFDLMLLFAQIWLLKNIFLLTTKFFCFLYEALPFVLPYLL